ncbi:hypothetical protein A9Q99_22835 [Gammaproteobacteria bacterium 45_16_T64]|nr:hypothetical protein A9Q99_22835 [Gammaproteobacteria bacterium 45_16_T64]
MPEPLRYQNPILQNLLASNYVIGTLRGPARRRFEALMQHNDALEGKVRQWENKMQPMHRATESIPPKKSTWKKIINRINTRTSNPLIIALQKQLRWYKYATSMAFTVAFMVGVIAWSPWLSNPLSESIHYVAILNNSNETPTMVVTLNKEGRMLTVDMLVKPNIESDKELQLWAVSRGNGGTKSLGPITLKKHAEKSLTKPQWGLIEEAEYLMVSVENPGGSSSPTGRVISKGICVKVEGWKSETG